MPVAQNTLTTDLLEPCYGSSVGQQIDRYTDAITQFAARYGKGSIQIFRAPDHVNIIGEHTDYNLGVALTCLVHLNLS